MMNTRLGPICSTKAGTIGLFARSKGLKLVVAASAAFSALKRLKSLLPATLLAVPTLAILIVARIRADSPQSGFQGRVTDMITGRPLSGALIQAGGKAVRSDADGAYRLLLSAGTYAVRAEAAGYIGMTETWQKLDEGKIVTLDFAMIPKSLTPSQEKILRERWKIPLQESPTAEELVAAAERGFGLTAATEIPRTIRVLMPDRTVVVMEMDEYLKGVVPQEMYPTWPMEALRAQAVAARCYAATARKHAHEGADVCTTVHCQVWKSTHYDTTDRAVDETHNVAAKYGGYIIQSFFFGHCDGHTRNSEDVWGGYLPYCRSVACPCGFTRLWGHGVGMCQEGARVLAQQGKSYSDILKQYYTGIQVVAPPPPRLSGGQVTPPEGHTYTSFLFQVTYADGDGDPPAEAVIYIDGTTHAMTYNGGDYTSDARYVYITTLPAGEHTYRFHFDDGYGHVVEWPTETVAVGPSVTEPPRGLPTPTPTATPRAAETRGGKWSQTTIQDWSGGVFTNIVASALGNGALMLAADALTGTYTSPVYEAPMSFVALGSAWLAYLPETTTMTLSLRASMDGRAWSDWEIVPDIDAEREQGVAPHGELVFLRGRYLQYRLNLRRDSTARQPFVAALTLIYIDSEGGPTAAEARSRAIARQSKTAESGPLIIRRADWKANESWMTWEPEYRTPKTFIIHHTVTSSGGLDPAAVVRAIYYYHAVTQGWGDIGYNYLVDDQGNIYEGRYGGEGVVGGHAKNYNWGSIGIAVLGDYSQSSPSAAARASLIELMAWKGNQHFIHPTTSSQFIDRLLPNIMGHRDCSSYTTCPGNGMYSLLSNIRQQVMERMKQIPPNGEITDPALGSLVRGVWQIIGRGSPAVTSISLWIDGQLRTSSASNLLQWKWNTALESDGWHQLRLVVSTAIGRSYENAIAVEVDNTPPTGRVSVSPFVNSQDITLATQAQGANRMQVSPGWLWEGEELLHQPNTGRVVSDTAALNRQAWQGRAGIDQAGAWYGPYYCGLSRWRSYWAYFRLKVADNTLASLVVRLDATDDRGQQAPYAEQALEGRDFPFVNRYVEFPLSFDYGSGRNTCQDPATKDGLELRTWFLGVTDLYLDLVQLFTAPEPYSTSLACTLPTGEGAKTISVRYLDAAGNPSAVYTATTLLDTTPPVWLGGGGEGYALVRDALSGLDITSGAYAHSQNSVSWGDWRPTTIAGSQGTTTAVIIQGPTDGARFIRFRVADRAGNVSVSPPYGLPAAATATPTSLTPEPTSTPTATPSSTASGSPAPTTMTPIVTDTPTATPTETAMPAWTATRTEEAWLIRLPLILRDYDAARQPTATVTPSLTSTSSPTSTPRPTAVPTDTPTMTASPIATAEDTATPSLTATLSATATATATFTSTVTPTMALTGTPSPTPTLFTTIIVRGMIYEAPLGYTVPISNAHVVVSITAIGQQGAAYSSAAGTYEVEFRTPSHPSGARVSVFAEHPQYMAGRNDGDLGAYVPGGIQEITLDVGLYPRSTPTATPSSTPEPTPTVTLTPTLYTVIYVHGDIYDVEIGPTAVISGAEVNVYLPGLEARIMSDAAGHYIARFQTVEDYSGERVDVVASKPGYMFGLGYGFVPIHLPGTIQFVNINVGLKRQTTTTERSPTV